MTGTPSDTPPPAPALKALAQEFAARRRAGEAIEAADFCAAHPEQATALRPVLAALLAAPDLPFEEVFARAFATDVDATLDSKTIASEEKPAPVAARPPASTAHGTAQGTALEERFDQRYRVLRTIGEGGFGKVYLVEDDLHPGEKLALKTIRVDRSADPEFEQRFRNEIRIMRALQHPGIPQIFNDGKTPAGEFFFTMEFLEGKTLDEVMRAGPLPAERVVRLLKQIVEALTYAHARNVVHRDLKPANVFVLHPGTEQEQVKVLDFGIAKVLRKEGVLSSMETMNTLGSPGTPAYMAPEQILGEEVDARTDIYALGVMLRRMLSGELPFSGATPEIRLRARLQGELPALPRERVPEWLSALSTRMLAPDRGKRPTLAEISDSLERQVAPGTPAARPRSKAPLLVAAAVVVIAGAAAAIFWPRGNDGASGSRDSESPAENPGKEAGTGHDAGKPPEKPPAEPPPKQTPAVTTPPTLELKDVSGVRITAPGQPIYVNHVNVSVAGTVGAVTPERLAKVVIEVDGAPIEAKPAADGSFVAKLALGHDGTQQFRMRATVEGGAASPERTVTLVRDTEPPRIELDAPTQALAKQGSTDQAEVAIGGQVFDDYRDRIELGPRSLEVGGDGRFQFDHVALATGSNVFALVATDRAGNRSAETKIEVRRLGEGPQVTRLEAPGGTEVAAGPVTVEIQGEANQELKSAEALRPGQTAGAKLDVDGRSFHGPVTLADSDDSITVRVLNRDDQPGVSGKLAFKRVTIRVPKGFAKAAGAKAGAGSFATAIVHEATGLELILVDPSDPAAGGAGEMKPFYLGRDEVTRGQYALFCKARGLPEPPGARKIPEDDDPVVNVTVENAQAFCQWLGGGGADACRLPTRDEWIFAAIGSTSRKYPWGDQWEENACRCNDGAAAKAEIGPVGKFPRDRSWCNGLDRAGSVSEWTLEANGRDRNVLGGSYISTHDKCTIAPRPSLPVKSNVAIGFRVARQLEP